MKARALGVGLMAVVAVYAGFLLVGGWFARGCVESRVESRLAAALDAEVTVGSTRVSFASGEVELSTVSIRRDGVAIDIQSITAALPSMGRMLVSRDISRVAVDGAVFEMSARGAVAMVRRDRKPLAVARLVLTDATIAVAPTAILPGLGRVELKIDLAESRDVELASALTWITSLDSLVANATLPGGAGAGVNFRDGDLELTGSWFGADALSVPFEIPEFSADMLELDQLKVLGKALARTIGKHVAKDKLIDTARDWLDL